MCFYYRVSIDGPDKASPTSQEIPRIGPETLATPAIAMRTPAGA